MYIQISNRESIFLREKECSTAFHKPENFNQEEKGDLTSSGILCKVCSGQVTTKKDQFIKNGRAEHCFFNPHGIAFVVSCFHRAAGCVISGQPSNEFTWFKGYAWSLAMCVHCQEHLGWFFQDPGVNSFYGLLVDKLVEKC